MNSIEKICPACDSGTLTEKVGSEGFEYKNISFVVSDYAYSSCDECGYEVVTPTQRKLNDKKIREHHRVIDGLLTASDIKRIRKKFNLTQHDAAEIFGGGANAFSKYENCDVIQSLPMDRLLRVADLVPSVFPTLVKITARQTYKIKSKQHLLKLSCDYGECEVADSRNLPRKIINIGMFRKAKIRKIIQTNEKRLVQYG